MKKLSTINESLLGGIQKKVMSGEVRKEDNKYTPDYGFYPVEGYEGWFISIDVTHHAEIFHPSISKHLAVCEFELEEDDFWTISDGPKMREDIYIGNTPECTDEEYDVVESDEFADAVDKTLKTIPDKVFKF